MTPDRPYELFMHIEGTHFGYILIPEAGREEWIDMMLALPYAEENKRIRLIVGL